LPYRRGTTLVEAGFDRYAYRNRPLPLRPGQAASLPAPVPGGPISGADRRRPTGRRIWRRSDAALPGEFGFPSAASHQPAALCHPGDGLLLLFIAHGPYSIHQKSPPSLPRDDGPSRPAAVPLLLPPTFACIGCRQSVPDQPAVSGLSRPITGASRTGVLDVPSPCASFHRSAPRRVRVSLPLRRTHPQLSEAGRQPYCSCSRRLLRLFDCLTLLYAAVDGMSTMILQR